MFWIIFIGYGLAGLMLIGLAQPMIEGKVKPNGIYGVRTPKTLGNEEIWYKANAYGGRLLRIVGLITFVAPIVLAPLSRFSVDTYALSCAGVLFAAMLGMAALTLKYVQKL